jgi:hypothetical protein
MIDVLATIYKQFAGKEITALTAIDEYGIKKAAPLYEGVEFQGQFGAPLQDHDVVLRYEPIELV